MRYLIISLLLTFCLSSNQIAYAGTTINTPKTNTQLTTKKDKKINRIAKKFKVDFAFIKALLSMVLGIGSLIALFLFLVTGFISASIPLLVGGTILTGVMSGVAMVFGIDTMKNNRRFRGFGLAGIITGAITLFGVMIMTILFASGSLY